MNRIFVINPKGGSGKSTIAIHTAIGFLNLGYKVLFIDTDLDQLTSYTFFDHRKEFAQDILKNHNIQLSLLDYKKASPDEVANIIKENDNKYNFIVVDTPGMTLHKDTIELINFADTIICPINESFVDLEALKTSLFFTQLCLLRNKPVIHSNNSRNITIVTTRRSPIVSHHQEEFYRHLNQIKKTYGLDFIQGFFESVSFKEMFRRGLTTLDCSTLNITPSNIQRKSIESIKIYIKYLIQKMLTHQYLNNN